MRTLLLALVLLPAVSTAVQAQSSVTIYGVLDLSITHERNGAGSLTSMESGVYQGSRLGFRGTESLIPDLSADFVLEMGINADTGAAGQGGLLFGRQAYVALTSKSVGALRLGRQYTPIYFAQLAIDPFVGGMKGDMASARRWFNNGGVRTDNSVVYVSPTAGGFSGTALYGFGESPNGLRASSVTGGSATYASGPWVLIASFHHVENPTATDSARTWFVGSTYDFGPVRLHGAADNTRGTGATDLSNRMFGVSAPFLQSGRLLGSWMQQHNDAITDAKATQWSLGYLHSLSKRTQLYTSVASVKNTRNSRVNSGGVAGASDDVVDVGIRHAF